MKNRQSYTHATRHAAFEVEFGGPYPTDTSVEFKALCAELVGVDTPAMVAARNVHEGTVQSVRENSPELYGRSVSAPMFPNGLPVLHTRGTSADCELDDIGAAVVASASHAGASASDDKADVEDLSSL